MRPDRTARIVIATALTAVGLLSCGPFGSDEEDRAGDALTELIEARNERDFERVCELIASAQLDKFSQADTTCERALPQLASRATTTRIEIAEVRVSGDRATVDATVSQDGRAGQAQTILLVKEDGDWKVSQVGL